MTHAPQWIRREEDLIEIKKQWSTKYLRVTAERHGGDIQHIGDCSQKERGARESPEQI